jgi:hypothetical protein
MKETYRDTGLLTGTHQGATGADLYDPEVHFDVLYAIGRLVEDVTDGSSGLVTSHARNSVTATLTGGSNNFWTTGDTYILYVGATKNAVISSTEVCRICGFACPKDQLVNGAHPKCEDAPQEAMLGEKGRRR